MGHESGRWEQGAEFAKQFISHEKTAIDDDNWPSTYAPSSPLVR